MTFKEYQKITDEIANHEKDFLFATLGLAGEAGEVANKLKKIIRDKNNIIDEETKENLKNELGDVLYYTVQLSSRLNISFEDVVSGNVKKLMDRKKLGVFQGESDNN